MTVGPATGSVAESAPHHPAIAALWRRCRGDCPAERFLSVVGGLHRREAAAVRGYAELHREATVAFLDTLSGYGGRMRPTTRVELVDTTGVLTGAVQWSQTVALWSSGLGIGERFVCAMPQRSYDSLEHRLVVEMLDRLRRGGRSLDAAGLLGLCPAERDRARAVAERATEHRRHPRLRGVTSVRLSGRDLTAVSASLRRRPDPCTRAALGLRRHLAEPLPTSLMSRFGSTVVNNHVGAMLTALDGFGNHDLAVPPIEIHGGGISAGPLQASIDRRRGTVEMYFGPHRVRVAGFGSGTPAGFDGEAWVISDAASTRAVLGVVAADFPGAAPDKAGRPMVA